MREYPSIRRFEGTVIFNTFGNKLRNSYTISLSLTSSIHNFHNILTAYLKTFVKLNKIIERNLKKAKKKKIKNKGTVKL